MRSAKKRIFTLILAATMLICTVPAAAAGDAPYYEWKQYDPRWASVVLTNQTMKQAGCLATSIAMLAVQAGVCGEAGFDPGVFAAGMKKAGGFDEDDDLVWEAIPKAVPGFAAETPWEPLDGTQAEKTAQLKGYLDRGYQVAVAVKYGGHWVALRRVTEDKAVMMNPGGESGDLFERYPAKGVTRVALLRAEKPKETRPPAAAQILPKEEYRVMAECVLAFLKDMGSLLLSIFQYVYTLGK
ncbi:MAG: hypothetical protein LBB75_04220 [Oscillospiraceae bacterium]|nr:hypothetical protein [Oscillospiraceae bacterium]